MLCGKKERVKEIVEEKEEAGFLVVFYVNSYSNACSNILF